MNGYLEFMTICNWPKETLAEQRKRILKEVLTPAQLAKRELFLKRNSKVTKGQLKLF